MSSLVHWFIVLDGRGQVVLLAKLLNDEGEIEYIDNTISVEVRVGFTEVVGDVHQIQDVDLSIAIDISGVSGFEIDLAVEVG